MNQLDALAPELLRGHYGCARPLSPLGSHGGFSGARLWRIDAPEGPLCLRAWPPGDPSPQRLTWIHGLMGQARAAGLGFVPRVVPGRDGTTWVERAGRLWEVTTWVPGRADSHDNPTPLRLQTACVALARVHEVWSRCARQLGPCPAVRRRLQRAREWDQLVRGGWRPAFDLPHLSAYRTVAEVAWRLVGEHVHEVAPFLAPWRDRPVSLHTCLGDVWHDHVLYVGDRVTGLIDYGGVRIDHPAADLARFLGSVAGGDEAQWAVGLTAYRRVHPLTLEEEALARLLDRTGNVLALANWLRWLYEEKRAFEDRDAVLRRLEELVRRFPRRS